MKNDIAIRFVTLVVLLLGFIWIIFFVRQLNPSPSGSDEVGKEIFQLQQRVDSLENRIYTIETLYRAHLEECSFISRFDIQVGYDNYLRLGKDDGSIRNK
jgi:hypothetical protein